MKIEPSSPRLHSGAAARRGRVAHLFYGLTTLCLFSVGVLFSTVSASLPAKAVGSLLNGQGDTALHGVIDFGDPNSPRFRAKLKQVATGRGQASLLYFGDSHVAADFFTGHLRSNLQQHYGDAGIGWVPPMHIGGQNHQRIKWQSEGWTLTSSRTGLAEAGFPMGGFIATPSHARGAVLHFTPTGGEVRRQKVTLWIKPLKRNSGGFTIKGAEGKTCYTATSGISKNLHWQSIQFTGRPPFTLQVKHPHLAIGGGFFQAEQASGVLVSTLGINGAKLSMWDKWAPYWQRQLKESRSDMVVLSYGTNESFEQTLNLTEYRQTLERSIDLIRAKLPRAVILLVSPPDTLFSPTASGSCLDKQPPRYHEVREIQQRVAQHKRVLYWDWQTAMGGDCIIDKWALLELAQPDFVHLSKQGYEASADMFYRDFRRYLLQ